MSDATVIRSTGMTAKRGGLLLAAAVLVVLVMIFAGARYGLLLAVGLGFGVALEGLRFGFAGPWRRMILFRDPAGVLAQLLSIALVSVVAIPLIAANPGELMGAQAPVGFAMALGAFVFGTCMQIVLGCGSGTLVNAGSGNPVSLVALPFFAIGSFAGSFHLVWWTDLGALPIMSFHGGTGTAITLVLLALSAALFLFLGKKESRTLPRRLVIAAVVLAALALLNLVIAGQPWGVVYGLGLWAAKGYAALGGDFSGSAFWMASGSMDRLQSSVLTDYTSLTNIGIIVGAFIVAAWRSGALSAGLPGYPARAWVATIIAGFLLGYSSRIAFGCNVGAFYSGISTGSLHGWVWFIMAFAGAFLGVKLRPLVGLEAK